MENIEKLPSFAQIKSGSRLELIHNNREKINEIINHLNEQPEERFETEKLMVAYNMLHDTEDKVVEVNEDIMDIIERYINPDYSHKRMYVELMDAIREELEEDAERIREEERVKIANEILGVFKTANKLAKGKELEKLMGITDELVGQYVRKLVENDISKLENR